MSGDEAAIEGWSQNMPFIGSGWLMFVSVICMSQLILFTEELLARMRFRSSVSYLKFWTLGLEDSRFAYDGNINALSSTMTESRNFK